MAGDKRGRKTASDLMISSPVVIPRPDCPYELDDKEAVVWFRVINALPAGWFTPENYDMLSEYCRAKISLDDLSGRIKKWRKAKGAKEYKDYSRMINDQRALQANFYGMATKMRMTQQARYTTQAAGTATKNLISSKPWETD